MYDVAIVGCGPVGALLANLLGQAGLSVLVLERDARIHALPRAVHFDGETMRVFQAAGLADEVCGVARPTSAGMHFVNAQGQTLMVRRGVEGPGLHDWANNWYFHQPDLDAVLRAGLRRFPAVEMALSHDVESVTATHECVELGVKNLTDDRPRPVMARYVVGCDGARSVIREAMQTSQHDLGLHQPWLVVDLACHPDSPRVQALPRHTVQHCDPARPRTRVYVGGHRHRFELMLLPGDNVDTIAEPANFWPLLSDLLEPSDATVERAAVYTFHSLIARQWRNHRLLLAGDSCHQTPPFLGQGLCAGIRDAANLWWKLVRVIRGQSRAALLDTYTTERIAHVREFIELAVSIGAVIQATDDEAAAQRDAQMRSGAPRLFDFPQPQLGPGVHAGTGRPVATVFGQPRLPDGRLLDDAATNCFTLIAADEVLCALDAEAMRVCEACDVAVLPARGQLEDALAQYETQALVLRPDHYIYGLADSAPGMNVLLGTLRERLALSPSFDARAIASEPER